jgi:hypothetical protein
MAAGLPAGCLERRFPLLLLKNNEAPEAHHNQYHPTRARTMRGAVDESCASSRAAASFNRLKEHALPRRPWPSTISGPVRPGGQPRRPLRRLGPPGCRTPPHPHRTPPHTTSARNNLGETQRSAGRGGACDARAAYGGPRRLCPVAQAAPAAAHLDRPSCARHSSRLPFRSEICCSSPTTHPPREALTRPSPVRRPPLQIQRAGPPAPRHPTPPTRPTPPHRRSAPLSFSAILTTPLSRQSAHPIWGVSGPTTRAAACTPPVQPRPWRPGRHPGASPAAPVSGPPLVQCSICCPLSPAANAAARLRLSGPLVRPPRRAPAEKRVCRTHARARAGRGLPAPRAACLLVCPQPNLATASPSLPAGGGGQAAHD